MGSPRSPPVRCGGPGCSGIPSAALDVQGSGSSALQVEEGPLGPEGDPHVLDLQTWKALTGRAQRAGLGLILGTPFPRRVFWAPQMALGGVFSWGRAQDGSYNKQPLWLSASGIRLVPGSEPCPCDHVVLWLSGGLWGSVPRGCVSASLGHLSCPTLGWEGVRASCVVSSSGVMPSSQYVLDHQG